jgi:hypothetical protein
MTFPTELTGEKVFAPIFGNLASERLLHRFG